MPDHLAIQEPKNFTTHTKFKTIKCVTYWTTKSRRKLRNINSFSKELIICPSYRPRSLWPQTNQPKAPWKNQILVIYGNKSTTEAFLTLSLLRKVIILSYWSCWKKIKINAFSLSAFEKAKDYLVFQQNASMQLCHRAHHNLQTELFTLCSPELDTWKGTEVRLRSPVQSGQSGYWYQYHSRLHNPRCSGAL